jgi:hypothetical protein
MRKPKVSRRQFQAPLDLLAPFWRFPQKTTAQNRSRIDDLTSTNTWGIPPFCAFMEDWVVRSGWTPAI